MAGGRLGNGPVRRRQRRVGGGGVTLAGPPPTAKKVAKAMPRSAHARWIASPSRWAVAEHPGANGTCADRSQALQGSRVVAHEGRRICAR